MKRKPLDCIAVAVLLMATVAAYAQQAEQRQMPQRHPARERAFPPPRPDQPLQDMQRQEPRQPGRMSPEERRQLRRDINEAGRELYPRGPHRPRGD